MPVSDGPLKVVLLTDVFPPASGGSGWSTYYLGKALAERGHKVRVVRPVQGGSPGRPRLRSVEYGGLQVDEIDVPAARPQLERLGLHRLAYERKASFLLEARVRKLLGSGADIVHAQHKISALAGVRAVRKARISGETCASVATIRDYWPLCPVGTRLFDRAGGESFECLDCHKLRAYLQCAASHKGGPAQKVTAPARWAVTASGARTLSSADAVIGVSHYVREELSRSGRISEGRLHAIPNLVHLPSVDRALATSWPLPDVAEREPFLLFAGKLDVNKGASMLPDIVERSGLGWPVVIAGSGELESTLRREADSRGLDFRFVRWLENEQVLRLMATARVLLFPSAWQEPLSRVLLEGCAAASAIVAINTGGTGDILVHGESGWLAGSVDEFVGGLREVARNDVLNAALRRGARRRAETVFSSERVAAQVEALYRKVLGEVSAA